MITEDYVSFEVAKLLKEKGFDIPYDSFRGVYINGVFKRLNPGSAYGFNDGDEIINVCSLQMAMKWLREVHKIEIRVIYDNERLSWYGACNPMNELSQILLGFGRKSKSYEEACEEAIRYCLQKLI